MSLPFFAGRSTLRRLHQTVQQNITRQHRINVRHESTNKTPTNTSPFQNTTAPPPAGEASKTARNETFTGTYWAWAEPIKMPLRAYSNMQKRSPLMTQWETTMVIYLAGDICAQTIQSDFYADRPYEPIRGLRAMLIGGIISIPSYKWFLWLGRNFNYPSHLLSLTVKILISQVLFTPMFASYFFGMQSLLSGSSVGEAWERIKRTVPVSWMNSWKLWPAVTAFSFTFVPPHNRSVFAGFIAIFWQTYLSWLNRNAELALAESNKMGTSERGMLVDVKKKIKAAVEPTRA